MLWCEIGLTERPPGLKRRFETLNAEIRSLGLEATLESITCEASQIEQVLLEAQRKFDAIRISADASHLVLKTLAALPANIATLRAADSLVKENGAWWPRCFIVDGLNQTLSSSVTNVDLGGAVFILGAGSRARAVIAALSRVGFGRMFISDPDDSKSAALVEELKRSYFGIQFQATERNMVTQLPGICAIAVNTLEAGEDSAGATELAYFNFLKTGGLWLDLALFPLNRALQTEARSVGGELLNGYEVLARTDALWFEAVCSTKGTIDVEGYAQKLAQT